MLIRLETPLVCTCTGWHTLHTLYSTKLVFFVIDLISLKFKNNMFTDIILKIQALHTVFGRPVTEIF